jgi:hypothetical protein
MANTISLTTWYTGNLQTFNLANLISNDIKIALLTSSYVPSMAHLVYTDLTNELPSANGYTLGGQALSGKTITGNIFKSTNPSWTATGTLTAFYWVMYDNTGSKPLICYGVLDYNNGSPVSLVTQSGDPLTIYVSGSGFFNLIASNGSL